MSASFGAQQVTFANNFNLTNSATIGNGGGTPRVFTLGNASSTLIDLAASSGIVRFQPRNGGSADVTFSLNASGTMNVASGAELQLAVVLNEVGGARAITKAGGGTLTLSGTNNTYTGDTTVNDGVLKIDSNGAALTATTYRVNGGILEQGAVGTSAVVRPIFLNGGGLRANRSTGDSIGTFGGVVTVGNTPSTVVTLSTATSNQGLALRTTSGVNGLTGGAADSVIHVLGPGTITLNDTSNYAGKWRISGGTLSISGNQANLGTLPGAPVADYITMDGGAFSSASSNLNINRGFTVTANGGTFSLSGTSNGSIAGIITGPGSIFKTNTGSLTLGNSDNDYQGSTSVLGGWLVVASGAPLGTAPSTPTDNIFLNGGTLLFTGSVTGTPVSANRRVVLGPTSASGNGVIDIADTKTVRIAGALKNNTGGTGGLVKEGLGTLQLESSSTSYAGNTILNAGTIVATASGAIGSGGTAFVGNGGASGVAAALFIGADGVTLSNPLWTNKDGGSANNLRTIGYSSASGTGTYSGQLEVNGGVALRAATGGTQVMAGVIKNGTDVSGGVNRDVLVNLSGGGNSGTVVFANANTYSGATAIDAGTLRIDPGGSMANTSGVFVGSGGLTSTPAALILGGASGGVTLNNNLSINPGAGGNRTLGGSNISGVNTFAGNIAMDGSFGQDRSVTVTAASGGNVSFSGVISGAGQNLTKIGGGVVTLSNTNTYTGTTTVSAGTLRVNGTHANAGSYSIGASGALGGGGVITLAANNNATVAGTVAPGSSVGSLTLNTSGTGVTELAQGGAYAWELNAQTGTAGVDWDLLDLDAVSVTASTGGFTIKIVSLNGANAPGPTPGWQPANPNAPKTFTIATSSTGSFTTGMLDKFVIDTTQFQDATPSAWMLAIGNSGASLDLVYVPEPTGAVVALIIGAGAMSGRRRRRV